MAAAVKPDRSAAAPTERRAPGRFMSKRQRLESLKAQLTVERDRFKSHWQEIVDHLFPRRGRFFVQDVNRGDRRSKSIIDTTATLAVRTMAAGFMAGATSPASPWIQVTVPDPDLAELPAVKFWCHDVTQRILSVLAGSNFYNILPTFYKDFGGLGTAAMSEEEDDESVVRFYSYPIGSYMIGNDAKQRVRTWIREYQMTVRQVVEEFGRDPITGEQAWDAISPAVRNQWERGQTEDWVQVTHVLTQNWEYDARRLESKYKRFMSCYYESSSSRARDEDVFLREEGFDEYPVFVARWELTGEDTYASDCPGMTALGDIKQLMHGEKRSLQAIDKLVSPPMTAPTTLMNGKVSVLPGDTTWVDARGQNDGFKPAYQVKPEIQQLEGKQQQVRNRIDQAFFVNLFLMIASAPDRQRTAREIEERHEEKLLALGPALEQLHDAVLKGVVERTFAIMLRRGLIPVPPEELEGTELKVEFVSIMAQAQKAVRLGGLERFANDVVGLAAVKPDVTDNINFDELVDELAQATGVSPKLLVPDDQVAQIRAGRAQQQQAAQQAALLKDAGAGAKDLAAADTRGQNALTDLVRAAESAGAP